MAGIKDLLSLYYWLNNHKSDLLDETIRREEKEGIHHSDQDKTPKKSRGPRKQVDRFQDSSSSDAPTDQ